MSSSSVDREDLRPDETACNHRAERALKLVWEDPDGRAVRIDSNPEPMYVTVEDDELAFWCYNYTWNCQEQKPVEETFGAFETVVDQLHAYANDGYGIGTVARHRMETEPKPRATGLGDFV